MVIERFKLIRKCSIHFEVVEGPGHLRRETKKP
jgi:hypothetical protein